MDISEDVFHQDKYRRATQLHGDSPKSLLWTDYHSAGLRLRQLVADLDIDGRSILDAGCGLGYLIPYLYAKSTNFEYLGVDINPHIIELAVKRYNGMEFRVANPFADEFDQKFDLVLSSGVMNANAPDWLNGRKKMIARLFELSEEAAGFNMAGGFEPLPSGGLIAHADTRDILDFCLSLTPYVTVRAHYSPVDFTILMFKKFKGRPSDG